jgi:hypothetical protein
MTFSSSSNSCSWMPGLTLVAILATFGVNLLSNIYPIGGMSIGEIANTEFAGVLITPANYAFAIWGLIYLGLFGFGIFQLLPAERRSAGLRLIRPWVIAACIAQIAWVYLFLSRLFWGSVIAMAVILISLIAIYLQRPRALRSTRAERWLLDVPFSIYLGWISVATIVNVATALYSVDWMGGGLAPELWTVALLLISGAIALTLLWQRQDMAFAGVVIWAIVAIAIRQESVPVIAWTAWGVALALAIVIALAAFIPMGRSPEGKL